MSNSKLEVNYFISWSCSVHNAYICETHKYAEQELLAWWTHGLLLLPDRLWPNIYLSPVAWLHPATWGNSNYQFSATSTMGLKKNMDKLFSTKGEMFSLTKLGIWMQFVGKPCCVGSKGGFVVLLWISGKCISHFPWLHVCIWLIPASQWTLISALPRDGLASQLWAKSVFCSVVAWAELAGKDVGSVALLYLHWPPSQWVNAH